MVEYHGGISRIKPIETGLRKLKLSILALEGFNPLTAGVAYIRVFISTLSTIF